MHEHVRQVADDHGLAHGDPFGAGGSKRGSDRGLGSFHRPNVAR
jgi:hypothetical protein